MSVALCLQNISRHYIKDGKDFTAVSSVDLEVQTGEFLTFLGPSGCGKTTTLRMIAGFDTINLGQENIEEVEILCIIVKHLLGLLMNENKWMRLYYSVKHYLFLWMLMFAAIFAYF